MGLKLKQYRKIKWSYYIYRQKPTNEAITDEQQCMKQSPTKTNTWTNHKQTIHEPITSKNQRMRQLLTKTNTLTNCQQIPTNEAILQTNNYGWTNNRQKPTNEEITDKKNEWSSKLPTNTIEWSNNRQTTINEAIIIKRWLKEAVTDKQQGIN